MGVQNWRPTSQSASCSPSRDLAGRRDFLFLNWRRLGAMTSSEDSSELELVVQSNSSARLERLWWPELFRRAFFKRAPVRAGAEARLLACTLLPSSRRVRNVSAALSPILKAVSSSSSFSSCDRMASVSRISFEY